MTSDTLRHSDGTSALSVASQWFGRTRGWRPDLAAGLAVVVIGLGQAGVYRSDPAPAVQLLAIVGLAATVTLHRKAPAVALGLVWLTLTAQFLSPVTVLPLQASVALVAFGNSRYGSRRVMQAGLISIPLGLACVDFRLFTAFHAARDNTLLLLTLSLLLAPWLLGLVMRNQAAARLSRQAEEVADARRERADDERAQAAEIAQLRAEQARLANDVHDVVGHSLAVILAQAESAQFLPDSDPARLKKTVANIAIAARQSLRDVRQVLSNTPPEDADPPSSGALDDLIEGVRVAGNEVRSSIAGARRPLPPELQTVALRVMQEMLTNALKHGRRGPRIEVEQHWEGELRMEVRNVVGAGTDHEPLAEPAASGTGVGLESMRRRLESVGGRLDVRRRTEPEAGETYTTTAWLPLRAARAAQQTQPLPAPE